MKPGRRVALALVLGLAVLLTTPGLFATDRPDKPKAADLGPISAALCGRGQGHRTQLADKLDGLNPLELPPIWQNEPVETLRSWLKAPSCSAASEMEANRFQSRWRVLRDLGRRLERAENLTPIGAALEPFRGLKPTPDKWPSDTDCEACAALRSAAATVAHIADRWQSRPQKVTQLGPLIKAATQREDLAAELCAAEPPLGARTEIESRFRYYSWTAGAARLFEVAALFLKPEISTECRGR